MAPLVTMCRLVSASSRRRSLMRTAGPTRLRMNASDRNAKPSSLGSSSAEDGAHVLEVERVGEPFDPALVGVDDAAHRDGELL